MSEHLERARNWLNKHGLTVAEIADFLQDVSLEAEDEADAANINETASIIQFVMSQ